MAASRRRSLPRRQQLVRQLVGREDRSIDNESPPQRGAQASGEGRRTLGRVALPCTVHPACGQRAGEEWARAARRRATPAQFLRHMHTAALHPPRYGDAPAAVACSLDFSTSKGYTLSQLTAPPMPPAAHSAHSESLPAARLPGSKSSLRGAGEGVQRGRWSAAVVRCPHTRQLLHACSPPAALVACKVDSVRGEVSDAGDGSAAVQPCAIGCMAGAGRAARGSDCHIRHPLPRQAPAPPRRPSVRTTVASSDSGATYPGLPRTAVCSCRRIFRRSTGTTTAVCTTPAAHPAQNTCPSDSSGTACGSPLPCRVAAAVAAGGGAARERAAAPYDWNTTAFCTGRM